MKTYVIPLYILNLVLFFCSSVLYTKANNKAKSISTKKEKWSTIIQETVQEFITPKGIRCTVLKDNYQGLCTSSYSKKIQINFFFSPSHNADVLPTPFVIEKTWKFPTIKQNITHADIAATDKCCFELRCDKDYVSGKITLIYQNHKSLLQILNKTPITKSLLKLKLSSYPTLTDYYPDHFEQKLFSTILSHTSPNTFIDKMQFAKNYKTYVENYMQIISLQNLRVVVVGNLSKQQAISIVDNMFIDIPKQDFPPLSSQYLSVNVSKLGEPIKPFTQVKSSVVREQQTRVLFLLYNYPCNLKQFDIRDILKLQMLTTYLEKIIWQLRSQYGLSYLLDVNSSIPSAHRNLPLYIYGNIVITKCTLTSFIDKLKYVLYKTQQTKLDTGYLNKLKMLLTTTIKMNFQLNPLKTITMCQKFNFTVHDYLNHDAIMATITLNEMQELINASLPLIIYVFSIQHSNI